MIAVRAAEAMYRWMMRAYPARFRQRHGLALFELFRDEARQARAARGAAGLLAILGRALLDTAMNAPPAWRDAWRHRTRRPFGWDLLDDLRLALRRLRHAPGFAVVSVVMLSIGIGAMTTVFGLTNAVLLRPLAAQDPDRVVRIVARAGTGAAGASARRFSYRDFIDYRDRARSVRSLSGVNLATLLLTADNRSDQILGEIASGDYMTLLGARAVQGRLLGPADDVPGAPPAAVISEALWRRRFGASDVIGRPFFLNRTTYTIVGVATSSFLGSFIAAPVDAWIAIETSGKALGASWRSDRTQRTLVMLGRLEDGVTRQHAQAELQAIATALAREFTPELDPRIDVLPGTLATGDQRRLAVMFLSLLLGLVGLVLVVACANVGNLLLARVFGHRRELAVRLALGASRSRLARMIAVDSLVLAGTGGVGALLLASWTRGVFANISPLPTLTLRLDLGPDIRVLLFTAATTVAAGLIVGVIGALQAAGPDVAPALKEDAIACSCSKSSLRLRGALAAVQVIVSLLLLIGAALFVRSVRGAAAIDLGFNPSGIVVLDVDASDGRTNPESLRLFQNVLRRIRTLPGADAVAVASRAPLDSSTPEVRVSAREEIRADDTQATTSATFLVVSAGFFDLVRTPIVAGRAFVETDDGDSLPVAIVNETLATRLWHGDAIGRRLWLERSAAATPCVVIGIAKDAKYRTLGEAGQGHVYLPFAQQPRRGMALLVRSTDSSNRIIQSVQGILRSIDPNLQGFFARTLQEHVNVSLLPVRFAAALTSAIAAIALLFAAVGLYSVMSFLVAERTSEIGLRMALGADSGAVLRLVIGAGMRLAGIGLALGIPIALASTRLLGAMLYAVSPVDPVVFGGVTAGVIAVTFTACYLPARRALRLDPLAALRHT